MSKTFKDLNFTFEEDENCVSCRNGMCISNATLKDSGKEMNVCVYTNNDFTDILITASDNSSTESNSDIEKSFTSENSAVEFLCQTFSNFKCF